MIDTEVLTLVSSYYPFRYFSILSEIWRASRVEIKSPQKNVDPERGPQNVNLEVHTF